MSIPNLPTETEWYTALAALDSFYLAIWMIAALLIAAYLLVDKALNIRIPQLNLNWLNHPYFWHCLWTIAIILRIPRFFEDFWYDETYTGVMARLPLGRFFEALKGDVHPPLHYLIAKLSTFLLGDSDFALRFPSLIAGLLFIYVMYRLALSITQDEHVAKLTALLVGILPTMIHYSGEARYPMMLALATCTAWLAILEDDSHLFALSSIATSLLHATGLVYAVVLIICAIYGGNKWRIAIISVAISVSCHLGVLILQSSDVSNGFWLWAMLPMWHIVESKIMMPSPPIMLVTYTIIVILFVAGGLAMLRINHRTRVVWIALAIFPPLSLFGLGLFWHPVYLPRALLASSIIPLIAWSWLAVHARRKALYQWLIAFTVIVSLFGYFEQMIRLQDKTTFEDAFAKCDGYDYIYTTSTNMSIASLYYAPNRSLAFIQGNNQHQELPLEARWAMGFNFFPPEMENSSICMVVNWNYYTTEIEIWRVDNLKSKYSYESEIIELDAFGFYEVIHID